MKKDKAAIILRVIKKQTTHKAKQNKDIKDLNNTINNLDIMEIDTTLYPAAVECNYFQSCTECLQILSMYWAKKQVSVNFKGCFQTKSQVS